MLVLREPLWVSFPKGPLKINTHTKRPVNSAEAALSTIQGELANQPTQGLLGIPTAFLARSRGALAIQPMGPVGADKFKGLFGKPPRPSGVNSLTILRVRWKVAVGS